MATKYQIINVKESKGNMEGNPFDNRMILCYSSETGSLNNEPCKCQE